MSTFKKLENLVLLVVNVLFLLVSRLNEDNDPTMKNLQKNQ